MTLSTREGKIWKVGTTILGAVLGVALLAWGVMGVVLQAQTQNLKSEIAAIESEYSVAQEFKTDVETCVETDLIVQSAYDSYFSAYKSWADNMQVMLNYGIFAGDVMAIVFTPQIASEGDGFLEQAKQAGCGQ
jgi:hypothetical protein